MVIYYQNEGWKFSKLLQYTTPMFFIYTGVLQSMFASIE